MVDVFDTYALLQRDTTGSPTSLAMFCTYVCKSYIRNNLLRDENTSGIIFYLEGGEPAIQEFCWCLNA